jgi:hypothetical protein
MIAIQTPNATLWRSSASPCGKKVIFDGMVYGYLMLLTHLHMVSPGVDGEAAKAAILADMPDLMVIVLPENSIVTRDYRYVLYY